MLYLSTKTMYMTPLKSVKGKEKGVEKDTKKEEKKRRFFTLQVNK